MTDRPEAQMMENVLNTLLAEHDPTEVSARLQDRPNRNAHLNHRPFVTSK